ncbi:hypothetical protein ICNINCKA_01941 [Synechococcus sp. CBW1107]|nr:hypothetical protein ICNINCKA_01941 [Synechococcus sp. CBW1107]
MNTGSCANSTKAHTNANSQTKVGLNSVDTSGIDNNSVAAQDFCSVAAENLSAEVGSVPSSDCSACCAADEEFRLFVSKDLKVGH